MKDTVESKLGMFFVLAIIFILLILEFLGGFAFFQRGFHVRALFKTVHETQSRRPGQDGRGDHRRCQQDRADQFHG